MTGNPQRIFDLRPRRGGAMVLVLLGVALAFIMGLSYLAQSATLSESAETVADHSRARQIAESGLMMTVSYIKQRPDWRVAHESGTWFEDHPLHGGEVSVRGEYSDDRTEPLHLTATAYYRGTSHVVSAKVYAQHQPFALAVDGTIQLSNQSFIDSFDSSEGPYGSGGSDAAFVATNTTASNGVSLQNSSQIYGDVYVGVGGDPDSVVSHHDKVTGEVDNLEGQMIFPDPAEMPTDVGGSLDSHTVTGDYTIDSDRHYEDFEIGSGGVVRVKGGDWRVRVNGDFNVVNRGELIVEDGATLRLYVGGDILASNDTRVNADSEDASRLVVYGVSDGHEHMLQNEATFYGIFDAPTSTLRVQNSAEFFGAAMVGGLVAQNDIPGIHLDRNPALIEANPRLPSLVGSGLGTFRILHWNDH